MEEKTIVLIRGDGIGPEVSDAVVSILEKSGAPLAFEEAVVGREAERREGEPLPGRVLEAIRRHRVALKGPVGTPIGRGFASVNVRLRQELELYANLRPVKNLPSIASRFENVDLVVIRENTEDLYAGLEHTVVPGRRRVAEDHHGDRVDAHRALRLRVRAPPRPPPRHGGAQGQHHEAVGRALPRLLPPRRRELSRHHRRRPDRGRGLHAPRHEPRDFRRAPLGESLRRHRVGSRGGPRGRSRARARRELRPRGGDLRGGPRHGAGHRRTGSRQSDGPAALGDPHAAPPRPRQSTRTASSSRSMRRSRAGIRTPDIGGSAGTRAFADAVASRLG